MLKLAVIVSGGGTNLQALIDQMEQNKLPNASIEVVISNHEDAYALERARLHHLATAVITRKEYRTPEEFAEALLKLIQSYEVDLIVLAGCLMLIPGLVVREFRHRIINIHPSLIPSFCGEGFYGLKVHEAALARGVKITGATVHFVDEGCDTGPIILQKEIAVADNDTPESLQRRVMEQAEWMILPEAVRLISEGRILIKDNKVSII